MHPTSSFDLEKESNPVDKMSIR